MNRILTAVCCIAITALPALGQTNHDTKAAMGDQQFIDFAAQTDMVEANLGQLAQNAAGSQEVKQYGQMLASDHTSDYQQLSHVASETSLNLPSAIDAQHNKMMIDPLQNLKGAAFDHKFIQEMIAGHTKAIQVYTNEAARAQNQTIKSYAEEALPVLKKHLEDAKSLEKTGKGNK